jgi:ESS family glutamate:Na+ symporter
VLTTIFVFLQNVVGMLGASLFGLPSAAGVIMGSIALVGGHGTAIAWAPAIAAEHGFPAAIETGAAVATLGLIVASLLGGPVAKFLIERENLVAGIAAAGAEDTAPKADAKPIDKSSFMYALLMVNIAVILGYLVHRPITEMGIKLPLFVPCLIMGIVLSNTVPLIFPRLPWPARTPSLALISDYALSVFLAISLMSMQLWTLAEIAGPLLVVVAMQAAAAVAFIVLALFPLLGPGLSGRCPECRIHRPFPRCDADRDREHDRGDRALRAVTKRLHHSAAGLGLFRRHHQCHRDQAVSRALS